MIRSIELERFLFFADDADPTGLVQLQNGRNYEAHVVAELNRLCPSSKGFLDIGANVGIHTLNAKLASPLLPCVACEASPQNQALLLKNISHNKLSNTFILPFPISNRVETIRTNACKSNLCCSVDGLPDSEDYPLLSQAFSIDSLSSVLPPIDLIKLDVEGFEGRVLLGAAHFLSINKPRILFEFCPEITHRSGMTSIELLDFLVSYGYKLTTLDYKPGMRAEFTSANACLNHVKTTTGWIADILAEPY